MDALEQAKATMRFVEMMVLDDVTVRDKEVEAEEVAIAQAYATIAQAEQSKRIADALAELIRWYADGLYEKREQS